MKPGENEIFGVSSKMMSAQLGRRIGFFHEGLKHQVMTAPGVFFDVNPRKRRRHISNFKSWARFSPGTAEDNVIMGLDRLERMINEAK